MKNAKMKQEIENKLREIGYTEKTDLEAILEALPKTLIIDEGRPTICHIKLKIFFDVDGKNYVGYQSFEGFHPKLTLEQGNESLVDTAARLLIALHEANLINFKQ